MPSTPGRSQSMIASEGASSRRKSLHASAPSVAAITSYPRSRSKACSLFRVPWSFSATNIFTIIVDHILWSARVCMLETGRAWQCVSALRRSSFCFSPGQRQLTSMRPSSRAQHASSRPASRRSAPLDRSISNDAIQRPVEIAFDADDGVVSRALFVTITRS